MQLPAHTNPLPRSEVLADDGFPGSMVPFFRLIDLELRQIKKLIDEQLAEAPKSVSRLLKNVNICSGKMIRPGLVVLSYRAVRDGTFGKGLVTRRPEDAQRSSQLGKSVTSEESAAGESQKSKDDALRVAATFELIHNATLLHDDVIDGGQKRRGLSTVNSLWGNESAVLLGDFLLSKAFRICAELEPQIVNIIACTAVRVCEGELRQVAERQNWQLSESEYIDIITEKSAALFSSCCLLGGLLGGAGEKQVRSLADFGLNTGIAFQITDDLLDIIGDESKTGKTHGSDIDNNKLTLAMIHLLRVVDEKKRNEVINSFLVNRGKHFEKDAGCEKEGLAKMLGRSGSVEYAHRLAQEFIAKGLDALTDLKESQAKNALIETAKFIEQRAL
jgi:geranylgeranyl pyrophosphate synthase